MTRAPSLFSYWPVGDVAKWPKAVVCKTTIRRFKSARRLHLVWLLALACRDTPRTGPPAHHSASSAPWVEWRDDADPVDRPVALVVDEPGGPLDRICADPDVTTFLNDRFHPIFHVGSPPSLSFLTADGCALAGPTNPADATAFIALANEAVVRTEARGRSAPHLTLTCGKP